MKFHNNMDLIRKSGLAALTISALMTMNCTNDNQSAGYIGPAQIEIKDGKMTPEALLAFGRVSDPQLSPDGKTILYGVSYISIEETAAAEIYTWSTRTVALRASSLVKARA